jgi:hypothetical protein
MGFHLDRRRSGDRGRLPDKWIAVPCAILIVALPSCQSDCDAGRAVRISEADMAKKQVKTEGLSKKIIDGKKYWIIEHNPPPGGFGGGASHRIEKGSCKISASEFSL